MKVCADMSTAIHLLIWSGKRKLEQRSKGTMHLVCCADHRSLYHNEDGVSNECGKLRASC